MLRINAAARCLHARAFGCRMLWFQVEGARISGPFASCRFTLLLRFRAQLYGNLQGGPVGCSFGIGLMALQQWEPAYPLILVRCWYQELGIQL